MTTPDPHQPAHDTRVIVGLMSGTSLDGISAAVVRFAREEQGTLRADLLAFRTLDYPDDRRERLQRALAGASPDEYCRLNFDVGHWLADAAVAVMAYVVADLPQRLGE